MFSDSQLIVGQITGDFDAKEDTMRAYRDIALPLVRLFNTFHIKYIPRAENSMADEMAQLASADQSDLSRGVRLEYLSHPAICPDQHEIQFLQNEPIPWASDILLFLTIGELQTTNSKPPKSGPGRPITSSSAVFCTNTVSHAPICGASIRLKQLM